jgi:hypothetical protein
MTNGRGVIHRPGTEAALRILLGERDCDGALGAVEMAFAPGADSRHRRNRSDC